VADRIGFRFKFAVVAIVLITALAACGSDGSDAAAQPQNVTAPNIEKADETTGASTDVAGPPDVVELTQAINVPDVVPDEMKVVWQVWELLNKEHVDRGEIDSELFAEAAIRGLLDALDDRHTNYVRPEAFNIQNDDTQGTFEGIGANVSMRRDGTLIIIAPIPGSPAEAMGIRPGDAVLAVDGISLEGLSLLEGVARIRGPRGSDVVLSVVHLGGLDPVDITITRDTIPLVSVLLRSEPGERIAHIRLTEFYANTADTLADMLQEAVDNGAQGLILDVRDNPGGLLSSVIDVVSQFVDQGLVLYQVDATGKRTPTSVEKGRTSEIPMVVLTNEFSASASEILAGALQDHHRALIVGATSFGKGSVNHLRRLSNGGGLWITIKKWLTPSGRLIAGKGVEPDYEVVSRDRQTAETKQLEKAREVLNNLIDSNQEQTQTSG